MQLMDQYILLKKLPLAKYSAIVRAIATMAKLGGATLSAAADIGLYASELKYQGRSFLGGMFEAMNNIRKNKKFKRQKRYCRWFIICC